MRRREESTYRDFPYQIRWAGRVVAGVGEVHGLASTNRIAPRRTHFEPVTLERGVTHDPEFEQWAGRVWSDKDRPPPARWPRREVIIERCNEAGTVVLAFRLVRCWVSEYQALPELDANASAVAIQSLRLEHVGWERMQAG